jgi:hypothetical protein
MTDFARTPESSSSVFPRTSEGAISQSPTDYKDDWARATECGSLEEGIKRDALFTAQASGRLGKCQAEARRATLPR